MPRQYHEAGSKKAARRLYELPLHEQIPPNVRTLTDSTLSVERHAPRRNVGDDAHIVPLRGDPRLNERMSFPPSHSTYRPIFRASGR